MLTVTIYELVVCSTKRNGTMAKDACYLGKFIHTEFVHSINRSCELCGFTASVGSLVCNYKCVRVR